MSNLLQDPSLLDAEKELQQLQLAPLKYLHNDDWTRQLFHQVVDEFLGHSYSYDSFVSSSTAAAAASSSHNLTPTRLHAVITALGHWLRGSLKNTPGIGSNSELKSDSERKQESDILLSSLSEYGCPSDMSSVLLSSFKAREGELVAFAKTQAVQRFDEWVLKDFDWSARMTLGSSSLSNVRTPVLSLSLLLATPCAANAEPASTKQLQLELNEKNLDAILAQMEKINAVVEQYSTTTST